MCKLSKSELYTPFVYVIWKNIECVHKFGLFQNPIRLADTTIEVSV